HRHLVGVLLRGQGQQVGDRLGTGRRLVGRRRGRGLHGTPSGSSLLGGAILRRVVRGQALAADCAAVARAVCSRIEARNRVLSMRPSKIGTPSSMHLVMTDRRSRPDSRASSVGVRWTAIEYVPSSDSAFGDKTVSVVADMLNRLP